MELRSPLWLVTLSIQATFPHLAAISGLLLESVVGSNPVGPMVKYSGPIHPSLLLHALILLAVLLIFKIFSILSILFSPPVLPSQLVYRIRYVLV